MAVHKKKHVTAILLILLIVCSFLYFFSQHKHAESTQQAKQVSQQPAAVGEGKIIKGTFAKDKFKSDAVWQKILSSQEFTILRREGTETPYTGALLEEKRAGTYYSVGCDEPLFRSEKKYESGTGWPSFWEPINENSVVLREDSELPGTPRVEVLDRCGNHLGHVFDDGPQPTGKRYCMNSVALKFVPDK